MKSENAGNRLLLCLFLLLPFFHLLSLPLLAGLGAWTLWQQRSSLGQRLRECLPLLFLLGTTLLLTPWTLDPARHLYGWVVHLAWYIFVYVFVRLRLDAGLKPESLVTVLLAGAVPICLLGWVQYANFGFVIRTLPLPPGDGLWSFYLIDLVMVPVQHAHARIYSLFYAPPMLGVYLAVLLPLGLHRLQKARSARARLLWAGTLFLLVSGLVLSYTRIAWIAAAIAAGAWFAAAGSRRILLWLLACLALLGGISLAWPPLWQQAWERLLSIGSLEHYSNAGRIEIWQRSWQAFCTHWFSGTGLLNFWRVFPEYRWRWPHAHSLLLQQLLEMGLVATCLFYAWLGTLFRRLGSEPLARALGCGLLAWLVCGWADYPAYEPRNQFLFWTLAALAAQAG
ncbi:MAG: O-antigen ligase family protein, partial [Candidatus Sericytochromatia bacterium]